MKLPLLPLLILPVACFGQAVRLQTEYLSNPIGLDAVHPRLSWQMADDRPGAKQTAYQLVVGTDSLEVAAGKGNIWQTGKVVSDRSRVACGGKALAPFTKYFWKVTLWDKDGKTLVGGATASFETGNGNDWKGAWISDSRDVRTKPAPFFRKTFAAKKKIRSARAYIAAGGLYELFLNGEKVGNHRLDPMYTRFDRRTLYVTYDVTRQLKDGANAVGVLLGNGWYNHQSTAVWFFHEAPWRNRPAFCLDLRITYEDGTTETISTDKTWKTALSPIVFNSIYTAEHYDSRKEQPGWNTASFDDKDWKEVIYRAAPSTHIVAQALHPIRNVEEIRSRNLTRLNDTTWVFDLGRTISGVSRFRVSGPAGAVIRLKHAERLYSDGRADMSNIDVHYRPTDATDPFQTDIFVLNGKGEQSFMPAFNYKGFQYVEVTAPKETELRPENLTGYFMHSDVPPVGVVRSSNPTLDKIWSATNNSYLSNLFGYPTDCPQREKNGWTGDAHIAVETGLYSFDGITVYEKWLGDHRDEQQPNGVLPAIIPTSGWGYEWANGPDWTSTIALIPWNLYLFYGDAQPLADNYDNLRRYVDHITDLAPSGLTSWGLGDWVPVKSKSPVELTSSIYYFVDATILARAAGILGKTADHARYTALAEKIRAAVNARYLHRETGIYGSGLQTELSVPLQWGLVPEELKAKVAANLARRVEADGRAIDVGLLGTKAILNALSENGYADLAYSLASRETFPSWGWWIKNGATTLYENWPIDATSDISLNHIMFGEIGAWMYKGLGGIKPDPQHPGFRNILLEPNFVAGLTHFEAQHEGPFGTIRSAWKRAGSVVTYDVVVPANSSATLTLPGRKRIVLEGKEQKPDAQGRLRLSAGTYHFTVE